MTTKLGKTITGMNILGQVRERINAMNPTIKPGDIVKDRNGREAFYLYRSCGYVGCMVAIEAREDGRRVFRVGVPGEKRVNIVEPKGDGWDLDKLVEAAWPVFA